MQLPYSPQLNIPSLSRLFENTSECYKLFWFQAILTKLENGQTSFTFEELVNEMIADAWYIVTEYHLNLGPKDTLEAVIKHISDTTRFKPSEKKTVILEYLRTCTDKDVLKKKRDLIKNVPYRLQAPFMPELKGREWKVSERKLAEKINEKERLMYYFSAFNGLHTELQLQEDWVLYLSRNIEIIKGWVQYSMIKYLQKRNPNVPGILDKLHAPQERNLKRVIKYWRMIMKVQPIYEIYNHQILTAKDLSIDHFVPWSYVAHDEFWNLHPTTKSINSKKSNHLPDWEMYFPLFGEQEYLSYQMLWKYEKIHDEFQTCSKEHLNSADIEYRLYREGQTREEFEEQLKEIILPVYESAKNSGFENWMYRNE